MARSAEQIMGRMLADMGIQVHAGNIREQPVFLSCEVHGRWRWRDTMDSPVLSPDCPHCIKDRKLATDLGRACIPPRFQRHSLDTFKVERPEQQVALDVAREFCGDMRRTIKLGRNLLFIGTPGTGKTHLSCGIAREFINAGFSALYVSVPELISMVRETWSRGSAKSERKVYRELAEYDLLVLDEVGVQADTDDERRILFNVINGRNENMRPLILMSNYTVPQVKDFLGERSFDRIREEGRVVTCSWPSWRGKGIKASRAGAA